jgi:archaemetzincin
VDPAPRSAPEHRTWREIALAALDGDPAALPVRPDVLDALVAELSRHVELPCRTVPAPFDDPAPRVPGRPEIDADRLLARLEQAPREAGPLVGLTEADLGLPLFTFVFGRARLGGSAAVVSLARLRPERYGLPADPLLLARRAAAEILHELGHLAGLVHCADRSCLMWFAASVEAADLRGLAFCAGCAAALPHGFARHPGPLAFADG